MLDARSGSHLHSLIDGFDLVANRSRRWKKGGFRDDAHADGEVNTKTAARALKENQVTLIQSNSIRFEPHSFSAHVTMLASLGESTVVRPRLNRRKAKEPAWSF